MRLNNLGPVKMELDWYVPRETSEYFIDETGRNGVPRVQPMQNARLV